MGRNVLAVVGGFFAMCLVVIGAHAAMVAGLGVDRLFQPGSYQMSPVFIVLGLLASIGAALAGGVACVKLGQGVNTVRVLAGATFVLGLINAGVAMRTPEPGPRPVDVKMTEMMVKGKEPAWYAMTTAALGGLGVMVGGGLGRQKA